MNKTFTVQFVESFPNELENGVLYVSLTFNTAVHLCACGCGMQTVTKLAPKEWCMTYNGKTISLYPSIGNWGFKCRSHYWVRDNHFVFIDDRHTQIDQKRKKNRKKKKKYLSFFSEFINNKKKKK